MITRHEVPKTMNTRIMMAHVDQGPLLFAIFMCVALWYFIGTITALALFGVLYLLLLFAATRDELFIMMWVISMWQKAWYDPAE